MWLTNGYAYAVVGANVYKVDDAFSATLIGALTTSTGRVSIAENGLQLVIAHTAGWHLVDLSTNVMTAVPGAPLDSIITYQDGYVIFTRSGDTFGITGLSNAGALDPLDFASAEGSPDYTISVLSDHRELWLFGTRTVEVWYNTGAQDFPFERSGNAFIEHGCVARYSPAKIDNSVFWVGRDINGEGIVFRADGYQPVRISTHALEHAFKSYADLSDAFGYCYQEEGHSFYCLTFPSADVTWVYDVAAASWHRRGWRDATTGQLHRHRANCALAFSGRHFVGDWENGKIYEQSLEIYDDDGAEIYRERCWAQIENENLRLRHNRLELIADMGVGLDGAPVLGADPTVRLQFSDDGGRSWSNLQSRKLGKIGKYKNRAIWRRLGMSRRRFYRLSMTDPVRVAWLGANLLADGANS
jgi:hypothetical protein